MEMQRRKKTLPSHEEMFITINFIIATTQMISKIFVKKL